MSGESRSSTSGGIGFCGLLAILFIGLKLGGVITWSWWWVLSPLWIPWCVVLTIIAIICMCVFVAAIVDGMSSKSKRKRR